MLKLGENTFLSYLKKVSKNSFSQVSAQFSLAKCMWYQIVPVVVLCTVSFSVSPPTGWTRKLSVEEQWRKIESGTHVSCSFNSAAYATWKSKSTGVFAPNILFPYQRLNYSNSWHVSCWKWNLRTGMKARRIWHSFHKETNPGGIHPSLCLLWITAPVPHERRDLD